jgi:competence ComEA-like helix-hairpin-helix protein
MPSPSPQPASARDFPAVPRWIWNEPQRRGLALILLLACGLTAGRLMMRGATLSDPPPIMGARATELLDRIDPNTATPAQLAALPGIGPSRAQAIAARAGTFRTVEDLDAVPGIGPVTLRKLRPHLRFDSMHDARESSSSDR